MSTAKDDDPRKILDYMEGFLISKTLFAACELGVFDHLEASERPLSAAEVAQALAISEDGTQRLLSACAGLELLTVRQCNEQVVYSNTGLSSRFLTRTAPQSLYQSIQYNSKTIYLCWHYLTDAVREGRNQYEKAFGVSSKDLFEALYRSDEEMVKFMQLMNSIWNICGKDVVTAFDLSPFKKIYDLGDEGSFLGLLFGSEKLVHTAAEKLKELRHTYSCSGALAKQCTLAYPGSTVTIFDLPKVVQMSREHFVSAEDKRISFHEGDFFKEELPEADLYILARILHDWTDERCLQILVKAYQSCRPGGGVLLVEALLHEDSSGPLTAQLYSLNMLVQTEGRERRGSEYASLLTAAGFTSVQLQRTGKVYDAVLARK